MASYLKITFAFLLFLSILESCVASTVISGLFSEIDGGPMLYYSGIGSDVYALKSDNSINLFSRYSSYWTVVSGSATLIGAAGTNLYVVGNPDNNHLWEYNTMYKNWTGVIYNSGLNQNITEIIEGGNTVAIRTNNGAYYLYNGVNNWTTLTGGPLATRMCNSGGNVIACVGTNNRLYIYTFWPSCNCYKWSDTDFLNGFIWNYAIVGYGGFTVYARNITAMPWNNLQQLNFTTGQWKNLMSPTASNSGVYASTANGLYCSQPMPNGGVFKYDGTYWQPIDQANGGPNIYGPATASNPLVVSSSGIVGILLSD